MSILTDDESLRDAGPAVHQRARGLAVGIAKAKTKIEITRKLPHAIRGARTLCCQSNKFHVACSVLSAHFLVIGSFSATRSAPRRPEIHDDDLAVKIREAKALLINRLKFAIEQTLGQSTQFSRRDP